MRGGEERFLTFGAPDGDTFFAWYFTPASGDFPLDLSQNGKILRQVFFSWERGDQV